MLVVHSQFLFGGSVVAGDSTQYQIPHFEFYRNAITEDQSFLWNPYNSGGFPAFAGLNGFFSPLHYFFLSIWDSVFAFNLMMFFSSVLALFLAIRFMQMMGLGLTASFIGGLSYCISEMMLLVHTTALSYALVFLPALFLVILKLEGNKRLFMWTVLSTLLIASAWLTIFPQFVIMIILAGLSFAIFRSLTRNNNEVAERAVSISSTETISDIPKDNWYFRLKHNKRAVLLFLISNVLGLAVGLVQILPTYIIAKESVRGSVGIPYEELADRPIRGRDLTRFFFPEIYTDVPLYISDGKNKPAEAFLYMGIVPFCLFVLSFFAKSLTVKFFRWLFFVCLIISIRFSPIFYLLTKLPVLGDFRIPSRYMIVGSFASAILVAIGLDWFLINRDPARFRIFLRIAGLVVACMVLMLVLFPIVLLAVRHFYPHPYLFTPGIKSITDLVFDPSLFVATAFPKIIIPVSILAFASIAIWLHVKEKISKIGVFKALSILVALEFFAVFFLYTPVQSYIKQDEIPASIEYIRGHGQGRVLLFDVPESKRDSNLSALAERNINLIYKIDNIDYYEKLTSFNVARLLTLIGAGKSNENFGFTYGLGHISDEEEKLETFKGRRALLDFLGIRYVVSPRNLEVLSGFKKVFELPVLQNENFLGVAIYENIKARPLLYFVPAVDSVSESQVYSVFLRSNFGGFFADCSLCAHRKFSGRGDINIMGKDNSSVTFSVASMEDQFLIFSQNYYPGWKALIDGQKTHIYKVNTVHMGIIIPEGKHTIKFEYTYGEFLKDSLGFSD